MDEEKTKKTVATIELLRERCGGQLTPDEEQKIDQCLSDLSNDSLPAAEKLKIFAAVCQILKVAWDVLGDLMS